MIVTVEFSNKLMIDAIVTVTAKEFTLLLPAHSDWVGIQCDEFEYFQLRHKVNGQSSDLPLNTQYYFSIAGPTQVPSALNSWPF